MTDDDRIDQDFAALPDALRAEIEGAQGVGLHHAPASGPDTSTGGNPSEPGADAAFAHPEHDGAGTEWAPDWEPLETYPGGVVMLDDGERQVLAVREDGLWMELADGNARPLTGFVPMLWSHAPDQVKYDLM